jgi:hypothetical protein
MTNEIALKDLEQASTEWDISQAIANELKTLCT